MAEYTGDRPRIGLLNQRGDAPLIRDISRLANKTLVRMFGNIMGPTAGCLTKPTFDTTDFGSTTRITIGTCVFGYAWETLVNGELEMEGGAVIYDPANREIQAESTVSLAGLVNQAVWLWFKRYDGASGTDMRRHWPVDAEVVAPTDTRFDEYVLFEATPLAGSPGINEDQGWFKFARIPAGSGGWTASVPTNIEIISFYDGWYLSPNTSAAMGAKNLFGQWAFRGGSPTTTRWGLVQLLQGIVSQLAIILDTTNVRDATDTAAGSMVESSVRWYSRPSNGMAQLNSSITGAIADIADLDARCRILFWYKAEADGDTVEFGGDLITMGGTGVTSFTSPSTGVYTYSFAGGLPSGMSFAADKQIVIAQVNDHSDGSDSGFAHATIVDGTTIRIRTDDTTGSPADKDHQFTIIGVP